MFEYWKLPISKYIVQILLSRSSFWDSLNKINTHSPEQFTPVHNEGQVQWYPPWVLVHVPPCSQGETRHSLVSINSKQKSLNKILTTLNPFVCLCLFVCLSLSHSLSLSVSLPPCHLPSSQKFPLHCMGHTQVKFPSMSSQTPLLWQGRFEQSDSSTEVNTKRLSWQHGKYTTRGFLSRITEKCYLYIWIKPTKNSNVGKYPWFKNQLIFLNKPAIYMYVIYVIIVTVWVLWITKWFEKKLKNFLIRVNV